jgi:hypothetical protein
MTLALVIVLLLAIASFAATTRKMAWGRPALLVTTVLALALGSASLVARATKKSPARQAQDIQVDAGRILAEQVLAHVNAGRLLVLIYAPVKGERLFTDMRLDGFTNALAGRNLPVTLAGPNVTPGGSPDESFLVWPQETLSAAAASWLAQNKDVTAVVSLMPFPPRDFSSRDLPFFAFAVHEMPEWQAGVRAGRTKAVLVSRPTIMRLEAEQTPPTWSDMFELITPQNIANYTTPSR